MTTPPLGPPVDVLPRPLPVRVPVAGRYVRLEPLHVRHAPDLWRAAQGGDDSWAYLDVGPFASEAELADYVAHHASTHDPMAWAARPVATGLASGWLTLLDIRPFDASVELGHIWFGPPMQRTRASTEALFLLMRLAADELGYRRLAWKCNALNAPSRRAAERLGFRHEGTLRAHRVVKGRMRDTAWYGLVGEEWPLARNALSAWLDPGNFDPDGTALRSVAAIRASLVDE